VCVRAPRPGCNQHPEEDVAEHRRQGAFTNHLPGKRQQRIGASSRLATAGHDQSTAGFTSRSVASAAPAASSAAQQLKKIGQTAEKGAEARPATQRRPSRFVPDPATSRQQGRRPASGGSAGDQKNNRQDQRVHQWVGLGGPLLRSCSMADSGRFALLGFPYRLPRGPRPCVNPAAPPCHIPLLSAALLLLRLRGWSPRRQSRRAPTPRSPPTFRCCTWEISSAPSGPPLSTGTGGATPSLLTPEQIRALLSRPGLHSGLAAGCGDQHGNDPASFDHRRLSPACWPAGVNRVSLGGRASMDAVLETLGRRHRRATCLKPPAGPGPGASGRASLGQLEPRPDPGLAPNRNLKPLPPKKNPKPQGAAPAWLLNAPHLSIYDLIVEPHRVRWPPKALAALPTSRFRTSALTWMATSPPSG